MGDQDLARLAASDPATPQATLAELAYEHPELRAAIAGNPSAYDGLLDWLSALDDPVVSAAIAARTLGVAEASDPSILRVSEAPEDPLGSPREPILVSADGTSTMSGVSHPEPIPGQTGRRWPDFLSKRFVIILGSLVVLVIVGIVVGVSVHNAALDAQATAAYKAQQVAANKANAANESDSPSPVDTATPSPTPTDSPTPLPPPSIVPAGFDQTWSQGFVAAGGYTETVAVSVGTPESLGSTYPSQVTTGTCSGTGLDQTGCKTVTFTSGKFCTANKATDAVVPISIDTRSTTAAFSQVVGASVTFQSSSQLQYEAYYNNGPVCDDGSSGVLTVSGMSTTSMSNGQGTSLPVFLIIQNYYTPDHPNGDPTLLAGIQIDVSGSTTSSTSWTSDGNGVTYQSNGSPSTTLPAGSAIELG